MLIPVDSLDDPRLAAYRNLKDRELARDGRRFIAEGEQVVRRLLASNLQTESVLVARRKVGVIGPIVPPGVPVYVASDETIGGVIGFEFHSGVLGCGIRPAWPPLEQSIGPSPQTLVVCPKITNPDNLGSMIRISAAFGVGALLLGPQCCDPYFRHSVRISMGAVFNIPIARSEDLLRDLRRLRSEWNFELVATVLSMDAQPLARAGRGANVALVFGGEGDGLDAATVAACDRRVTIPMRRNTDSLNVAVAAGIFLHHFVDVCDQAVRSNRSGGPSPSSSCF